MDIVTEWKLETYYNPFMATEIESTDNEKLIYQFIEHTYITFHLSIRQIVFPQISYPINHIIN
ncbi:MAG: hypothetical protein IKM35_08520 [Bacteroidaceae bacterium]|nr:hypothetical protein [Bacteroidaceae bacterium]